MIYQLPDGRSIEISIEQYLSMHDDELAQLVPESSHHSDDASIEIISFDDDENLKLDLKNLFPDDDSPTLI
jgi:hypothetical protein